ncbi:sterol desaturase family protein [Sphingomonas sp. ERG5]|uniref:sterol desaturase family protein n=1 Tax=Sphingomonas sp. ERG5 TaxID=1381597 RepID=UPI00068BC020|nr:sterol desaturase family protein [Sphingomonas sp. ERG5]
MPNLPNPVSYAVPAFVLFVVAEMIFARLHDRSRYHVKDTLTSLLLGLGSTVASVLTGGAVVVMGLALQRYAPFQIPYSWWAWTLAFVLYDLSFYVAHRASHRMRLMWASHVIHHSSQHYNLSTALRQPWTNLVSLGFIFFLPLFLLGFPPPMLLFVGALDTVYQFWIHTETIGRLPRWVEAVMNTPSHHRVHHATNPRYLDKNYAGVFIVWDRMFGTFEPERDEDRPRYGIVKNLGSFNLLWAAFHEWVGIARDVWRTPGWKNKLGYIVAPPGWSHDGSRDTSETIKARWRAQTGEVETGSVAAVDAGARGEAVGPGALQR